MGGTSGGIWTGQASRAWATEAAPGEECHAREETQREAERAAQGDVLDDGPGLAVIMGDAAGATRGAVLPRQRDRRVGHPFLRILRDKRRVQPVPARSVPA